MLSQFSCKTENIFLSARRSKSGFITPVAIEKYIEMNVFEYGVQL